jgi:hypothetical protein
MTVFNKTEINLLRLLSRSQKQVDEIVGGDEYESIFYIGRFKASLNYMNVLYSTLLREKLCPETRLAELRARIDIMQTLVNDADSASSRNSSIRRLSDRSAEGDRADKVDMISQKEIRSQLLKVLIYFLMLYRMIRILP